MGSFDVDHVARAAGPYIGAVSAWMLGRSWSTRWLRLSSRPASQSSLTAGAMARRLGRTPLLKARGLIRKRRYTR